MPPNEEEFYVLARALEDTLRESGFRDPADQIVRVLNEPLGVDDLPDARGRGVAADDVDLDLSQDAPDVVLDPSMLQRFLACLKIVDLMVVEPLELDARLRHLLRARFDANLVSVGERDAAVEAGGPDPDVPDALGAWRALLTELTDFATDGHPEDV